MEQMHNDSNGQFGASTTTLRNNGDGTESREKLQSRGVRRSMKPGGRAGHLRYDGEEDTINKMGIIYNKILNSSLLVRYLVYILPLGIVFAVPMIIGATVATGATIGDVRLVWFFMWLLICWVGLWVSKLVSHYLPFVFQYLCGVISPGTKKYALILKALEIELSLCGWALVALCTFMPIMRRNPDTRAEDAATKAENKTVTTPDWETIVQRILAAALVSSLIFLGEKLFIQFVSINYHRKQFSTRIRESKGQIRMMATLYEASRAMFPAFCVEFAEEDSVISDSIDATILRKRKRAHQRNGSATPLRLLRDVGRFGDKLTSAFGNVAHEITGKQIFNPDSAQSIVMEALERNRSSEALAKRLWLSFVIEGHDALYIEDVVEVLGLDRQALAEECFITLDLDGNGDVTLDEMIMVVSEMGRARRSIANSMHDVDQAINVMDRMLCVVVFFAVVFTFSECHPAAQYIHLLLTCYLVAFLNTSFVTTLATAGTALLSLSFVFSVTCQEVLGSCIFLFVKHPFDIGDRVDLNLGNDQVVVEHISLLFTIFRRINNHRTVQIPNNILNTLWIENVSRSKAMREQITMPVHFDTTIEDIQLLRIELSKFVTDKDNARDFQSDIQVEVQSVGNLDKLELIIDLMHKSNWANETLRAARRSKFMCALVLALRKVPIYGPGAGDPALGEPGKPYYYVTIPDGEAAKNREKAKEEKNGKRMVPARQPEPETESAPNTAFPSLPEGKTALSPISEVRALDTLNERNPALDGARDDGTERVADGLTGRDRRGSELKEVEEMRGVLRRATTQGRRKSGKTSDGITPVSSNDTRTAYASGYNSGAPRIPQLQTGMLGRQLSIQKSPIYEPPSGGNVQHGLAQTQSRSQGVVQGQDHQLYTFPSSQQGQQQPQSPSYYHPQQTYPSFPTHAAYLPPPSVDPEEGEETDGFRGAIGNEEEAAEQPKVNAGSAWSAGQWRNN